MTWLTTAQRLESGILKRKMEDSDWLHDKVRAVHGLAKPPFVRIRPHRGARPAFTRLISSVRDGTDRQLYLDETVNKMIPIVVPSNISKFWLAQYQ